MVQPLWKTIRQFLEKSNRVTIQSSKSISGHVTKRIESRDLNRYLHIHVQGSISHSSRKVKPPQCPLMDEWVNKMWLIHTQEC